VDEADEFVVGTGEGFGREEGEAEGLEALHFGMDVIYFEGYVVQPFATLLYEFGQVAVGYGALYELYLRLARLEEGGDHTLALYGLLLIARGAQ
jgi:hypothetical protein